MAGVLNRRWMRVVGVAAVASIVLAIPAAADLDLIAGDPAQVAYTFGDGIYVRSAPDPDAEIVRLGLAGRARPDD
jgi:hypothetical protein